LGICYGMQLMTHDMGGKVERAQSREYGKAQLSVLAEDVLFNKLAEKQQVLMSHGDYILELPPGFQVTAKTANTPVAAISDVNRKLYGIQFHPEVRHTPEGQKMLEAFLYNICGCSGEWDMQSFIDEEVAGIRREVGDKKVISALSGGVDSAVSSTIVADAIGDQLTCIFVDHGLLRAGEAEQVKNIFR